MYSLDYYKAIERPEPEFHVGQKVAVETRYRTIRAGVIAKVARVWVTVRFSENNRHMENFHMTTYKSQVGDGSRILVPEVVEYQEELKRAESILKAHNVGINDWSNSREKVQLTFYLADAVAEFFAEKEDPHARGTPEGSGPAA